MFFSSPNSFKKEKRSTWGPIFFLSGRIFLLDWLKKFCKEVGNTVEKGAPCLIWLASLVDWLYLLCCVLWRGTGGGGSSGRVDPPPHPPPHSTLARPQQEKSVIVSFYLVLADMTIIARSLPGKLGHRRLLLWLTVFIFQASSQPMFT